MPVRKDIVTDDGLHTATKITIAKPSGRADLDAIVTMLQASASAATFEGAIGAAERYWLTVPATTKPTPLSKPWYRERILREITWLRRIFAEGLAPGNIEWAIVRALNLGATIEEAVWRFGIGPAARLGGKVRGKNRAASVAASRVRRQDVTRRDGQLLAAATEYRRRHPDHSLRAVAKNLAPTLGLSESTIRRRLAPKKLA